MRLERWLTKLRVEREQLEPNFLKRLYRGLASGVKTAASKIRALLHLGDRLILVGLDQPDPRLPWLKLHEVGHFYLPWQRDIYSVTEDCKHSLEPTVTEQFEHEANLFAAEVLFQGECFQRDARDLEFGIMAPVRLKERYGASIYACVWRYVSTHPRACAVIVLEKERLDPVLGPLWPFKRFIASPKFRAEFGAPSLPEFFTVGDGPVGEMLPRGKQRFMRRRDFPWRDRNGEDQQVLAEAFYTGQNVFLLVFPSKALARVVLTP